MAKPKALAMPSRLTAVGARAHAADDRRAAAEEHQGERSDKFRQLLVHILISLPIPAAIGGSAVISLVGRAG